MRLASFTLALWLVAGAYAQDLADEKPRFDIRGHRSDVHQLAFTPDGKLVAAVGAEGSIKLWDVESAKLVREYAPRGRSVDASSFGRDTQRWIEAIAMNPAGTLIAEAALETDRTGTVRIWKLDDANKPRLIDGDAKNARAVAFSPDGKLLAMNTRAGDRADHRILLRDVETGNVTSTLADSRLAASLLAFSSDGKHLATAGATKLMIWDIATQKVVHDIKGYSKNIQALAFSPDGRYLAASSAEDVVRVWRVDDGKKVKEFGVDQEGTNAIAFSPSGKTLATAGNDKSIKLWNPETGKRYKTLWAHAEKVLALAFSPDGKTLTSGGKEGTIVFWNFDESSFKEQKDEKPADKKDDKKKPGAKKP